MQTGFFAGFMALTLLVIYNIKRYANRRSRVEKAFWAREAEANAVRRKSLDGLNYVRIPLDTFPTHLLDGDRDAAECIEIVKTLASRKIVNLTGWTNTDLKFEYGAANITALSEYDQNYTLLARTLQKWADILIRAGHAQEASVLMEFAVSTDTDVSRTYYQLADYYVSQGKRDRIQELIRTAENLRSSNKNAILEHLKAQYEQP